MPVDHAIPGADSHAPDSHASVSPSQDIPAGVPPVTPTSPSEADLDPDAFDAEDADEQAQQELEQVPRPEDWNEPPPSDIKPTDWHEPPAGDVPSVDAPTPLSDDLR